MSQFRARSRRNRTTILTALVTFATAAAVLAAPMSASAAKVPADPPKLPFDLEVTVSPSETLVAGRTVTITGTATNNTGRELTLNPDAQLYATIGAEVSLDLRGAGCYQGPGGKSSRDYLIDLPTKVPAGAKYTCKVTFVPTQWTLDDGGVFGTMVFAPDGWRVATHSRFPIELVSSSEETTPVRVLGSQNAGETLTAKVGFMGHWDRATAFQWVRDGVDIADATTSTHTVTPQDENAKLAVRVIGTDYRGGKISIVKEVKPADVTSATPTINGTAKVGSTVTAKPGEWETGATLAYQWNADGTAIKGATSSTLSVPSSAFGKKLTVTVTGTKTGLTTAKKTSAETAKVAAGTLTAPAPAITGTVRVGQSVTAKPGTWTRGTKLTYQWKANGTAIKGATKATLSVPAATKGKKLTVTVTGTLSGYATASKTSAATKAVAAGTITAKAPTISGTAQAGKTLTAKTAGWSSGVTRSYQWYANGKTIKGATKSTFKVPSSLVGKKLTVKVTAKKSGYTTVSKTSKATATVKKAAPKKPTGPTIGVGF